MYGEHLMKIKDGLQGVVLQKMEEYRQDWIFG